MSSGEWEKGRLQALRYLSSNDSKEKEKALGSGSYEKVKVRKIP